ncbi:hypothetical protein Glove_50g86 [Diversispora epigaea]|uniref:Uncharacterized protein n=1 Tax=Diversispora epigaea TaxID=1348612 RepID=A0A397JGZ3_9GLOM|nr:hypothetical protein Glove_50g86 [Diversispora epigaea]
MEKETDLLNKGLISADRSIKATLLLTIPRSKFKSSAKDLSTPIFEIKIQGMDSDLEAFSHNPAIVELLLRQHFISRVKLTCLTTV